MTKTTFHAVLVAVAVAVGGISYTAPVVAGQAMSAAVAKPLDAANKAIRAKKWDEALGHLREVNGISGKSAYETHVMNQLMAFALANKGAYAEAVPYIEAQINSSQASASEKTQLNKQLLGIQFNLKNYAKAVELGQALIASGAADSTTFNVMAQAYEKQGKLGDAVKFIKGRVDGAISGGRKPAENDLLILLDYQKRLKDSNGQVQTFERLVSYYPKADYWANILSDLVKASGNSDAVSLNLYRLMYSTGTLKKYDDFTEYAQLAMIGGAAAEAVSVMQSAMDKKLIPDDRKGSATRLLESAKKQAAADQAGLAKAEAAAAAAKTGDADVRLGQTYFGVSQFDKAVEVTKRGIGKGGLKSAEEATLLLGIAQLRAGKKGDASTTLKSIKTGDPKIVRLASLWALHAK